MPSAFPHNPKWLLSKQPFPWHDLGFISLCSVSGLECSPLYPFPTLKVPVLPGSLHHGNYTALSLLSPREC